MGVFDGVSKRPESIGVFKTPVKPKETSVKYSDEQIAERKAALESNASALNDAGLLKKAAFESPFFPGTKRVPDKINITPDPVVATSDVANYVSNSKHLFTERLTDSLFIGKINTMMTEASVLDDEFKSRADVQEVMYEIAMGIYNDIKSVKDMRAASESSLPYPVGYLYQLSLEAAEIEAAHRFEMGQIQLECGNNLDKIKIYLNGQVNTINLESSGIQDKFEDRANSVILESGDVISAIKDKVTGQLNKYKENVEKINEIKSAVTDADPDISGAKANGAGGDDAGDTGGTDDASGASDNPDSGTGDSAGGDTAASGPSGGDTDTGESKPDEAGDTGDGSSDTGETGDADKQDDDSGKTEPAGDDKKTKSPLSEEDSSDIETAASFAETHSGTFNVGDEKFGDLYSRYCDKFKKAADAGNVDELTKLGAVVKTAAERIGTISESSNKKYTNMAGKLSKLSDEVQFEVNKKIQSLQTEARNQRTTLESLVLGVAMRYKNGLATESGDAYSDIPGENILREAVSYYVALETFNTLKILDLSNRKERDMYRKFVNSLS
jgi:hypothetical protein